MPAEAVGLTAGQIVLADWRGASLPKEPNKRRPAVVIEDEGLFAPSFPTIVLVPLTTDAGMAIPDLSVPILPTAENGCSKPCWALPYLVAATSKRHLTPTQSCITSDQLTAIRQQVALLIAAGS